MQPAAEAMHAALGQVTIRPPAVPVLANVTASETAEPDTIRRLLVEQVTGRVRWRESMGALKGLGVTATVEAGGNKVLTGMGMVKAHRQRAWDHDSGYTCRNRSFREGTLMFDLTGKTALVTGASGGIGGEIARALHAQAPPWFCPAPRSRHWTGWRLSWALLMEVGAPTQPPATCPISPRSRRCPRRRKPPRPRPSTYWSTMPASPKTIFLCA